MKHVGVDLGGRQSSICILDENGNVLRELTMPTRALNVFLERLEPSIIVIESCAESRKVALMARGLKHEVRVVPTAFVRSLGVGARRIKTDKRDARALADASFRMGDKLPTTHVRGDETAAMQELLRGRALLIESRTASINFVKSWLRKELLPRLTGRAPAFSARVRELLPAGADPHGVIEAQLAIIDQLNDRIAELTNRISELAKADERAQRLQAIPGVGPIVALAFLVAIDDPKRFASASHLASYVGLSPGESTTGGRVQRIGIVAAGQTQLRALLIQGAHSKLNSRKLDPMALWARELALTKKRQVVACALARRMAVVMWAMLRDGTRYDPSKNKPRRKQIADELAEAIRGESALTT